MSDKRKKSEETRDRGRVLCDKKRVKWRPIWGINKVKKCFCEGRGLRGRKRMDEEDCPTCVGWNVRKGAERRRITASAEEMDARGWT